MIFLGFVPICALGLSQIGRMNLGMDASTFKYYTMCGLQEGFEPFAVNMNRDVAMWFSKRLPTFVNVPKNHPHIEVTLHVRRHLLMNCLFSELRHSALTDTYCHQIVCHLNL